VINAVTGVPMKLLIHYIWPWIAVLIASLLLMILVPDTVLAIPKLFGYVPGR
jgi:TRAP-type C4-dicarboxylate transport system permease large subunit